MKHILTYVDTLAECMRSESNYAQVQEWREEIRGLMQATKRVDDAYNLLQNERMENQDA